MRGDPAGLVDGIRWEAQDTVSESGSGESARSGSGDVPARALRPGGVPHGSGQEVSTEDWLEDTRASYDTVAVSYADQVRHLLDETPEERAAMALFADLVRTGGGGPVADVGCGPGRITAHLHGPGVDAFGIDLSPGMVEVARRDHPGLRFEVGSMTDLDLADGSMAGLVAWYSLIHVPDDEIGRVLAHFRRVLRAGGPLLLGFHVGDGSRLKTRGYGGHPMKVHVHRRQPDRVTAWLDDAGFSVGTHRTLSSAESTLGGVLLARRRPDGA
ncbi:SAM-dependent methyltransferase OS=Streptomyces griseomycini OX=66895 GN=FHS37_002036 PE=4 SV=1 [Streptomyces griseomycini]|uniref:SAM-dependent methyltransferase n=1 Tax=Streptomyces griseomycini TaxID=66895 RepID=A0A7W7LYL9_9ACTN|nr:SAM-dependent methyltransferase [Streptomyces griseomycini]GGR32347.1 methyltransferase [Streptomyces griseomycini]